MEFGLRLHHANAGAPPDGNGLVCANCHPGDPAPPPESGIPPYYLLTTTTIKDPCLGVAIPGEDLDGDGFGLDNDGDLFYDGADADCTSAVEPSTWGRIKEIYQSSE